MARTRWERLKDHVWERLKAAPSEIGETLASEGARAVTDVRQRAVEEAWFGRITTPREQEQEPGRDLHGGWWAEREKRLDAAQHEPPAQHVKEQQLEQEQEIER